MKKMAKKSPRPGRRGPARANVVHFRIGDPTIEAARGFLTRQRVALLRLIKRERPSSLYGLAKLAKRGFPAVLRDVEQLRSLGLVRLARSRKSRRQRVPTVAYDAIHLWVDV